ncbi:tRNA-splicing endonuclease subunit SEN2 [Spathaspora sp. JA1]|nr:tRNA-splicing endonuclease subunit SEN2 [Spathaspora sp. JA1]
MAKRNNKQLNKIYSRPLPITLTSQHYGITLPTLYPHNPISWLWFMIRYFQLNICYTVPESKTIDVYWKNGIFKVVDEESMLKLWQSGFFGKGVLSRSEPTWKERVLTRKKTDVDNTDVAMEDLTKKRREERKVFKSTRAELQSLELKQRQGIITDEEVKQLELVRELVQTLRKNQGQKITMEEENNSDSDFEEEQDWEYLEQLEYLQLQLVETFFLKFGLNVINIPGISSSFELFETCCLQYETNIQPNNKFILDYVVYHHFRTLGWCVRSGIKFGTDFLLYKRGPPFTHAEYCVLVMNSEEQQFDWFQMAAKARVIGTVKKIFVLVYIECPSLQEFNEFITTCKDDDDGLVIRNFLSKYKVSEILYRRWSPSRTRD